MKLSRRSARWAVASGIVLAGIVAMSLVPAVPSHPPAHFWIRVDSPDDVRAYASPGGDEFRGWRFGDFGAGSHGLWPSRLDAVPPATLVSRLKIAVGLADDVWPYDVAGTWETAWPLDGAFVGVEDGWCEYVWTPDVIPDDAGPAPEFAGVWEDMSGSGRNEEHVTWSLATDGHLVRDHSTTVAGAPARWAGLGDVLYLEWFPSWAPTTRIVDVRVVAPDGRTWRRPQNSLDVGRRR